MLTQAENVFAVLPGDIESKNEVVPILIISPRLNSACFLDPAVVKETPVTAPLSEPIESDPSLSNNHPAVCPTESGEVFGRPLELIVDASVAESDLDHI